MSILNSVIKLFVGDKQQKDLKILQPVVEDVKKFEAEIAQLSHDGLRAKTQEFKNKIKEATKEFDDKIETLEEEAKNANIDRQEDIYTEIDSLKDEAYKISEETLLQLMPEAFAVIKETAKRFVENEEVEVTATALLDGFGDGVGFGAAVGVEGGLRFLNRTAFGILQATRTRISRTEYISCPSCGRTLFDLQETTARIRAVTDHLKGIKIGIMGCIVNGPGEMADADYGYVGTGPGKITLYKEKEVVERTGENFKTGHYS